MDLATLKYPEHLPTLVLDVDKAAFFFVFAFLDWVGGWDVWSVSSFVGWDVFGEGFGVPKRNKTTAVPNLLDFLDTLC